MKIKVSIEDFMPSEFELTEREVKILCNHSLERALNLALHVAEKSNDLCSFLVEDDLNLLKATAVRLWCSAQNAVIAKNCNMHNDNCKLPPEHDLDKHDHPR